MHSFIGLSDLSLVISEVQSLRRDSACGWLMNNEAIHEMEATSSIFVKELLSLCRFLLARCPVVKARLRGVGLIRII